MIPVTLSPLANHLWQSTLFAGLTALLTLALSRNRAQIRYGLWLAASVKFLVPFSLLVSVGSRLEWRPVPAVVAAPLSSAMERVGQPFTPVPIRAMMAPAVPPLGPALLFSVWFCGCAAVLFLGRPAGAES